MLQGTEAVNEEFDRKKFLAFLIKMMAKDHKQFKKLRDDKEKNNFMLFYMGKVEAFSIIFQTLRINARPPYDYKRWFNSPP